MAIDHPASSTPTRKKRPAWLTALIVIVAAVVLIGLGLVGWALFRPLLPGDYSKVAAGSQELIDQHETQVLFQLGQVVADDGTDLANTQGKVDLLTESVGQFATNVEDLTQDRAFNDQEIADGYQPVRDAIGPYQTFLDDYGASVVPVKTMQQVCAEFDAGSGYLDTHATEADFDQAAQECLAAVQAAKDVKVQTAIVDARETYLAERRAAWQLNGEARAGGRLDGEKAQQARLADADATRTWRQADTEAAQGIIAQFETEASNVQTPLQAFHDLAASRA